jgi:DNA-binding CsgD family transcriptional regulator
MGLSHNSLRELLEVQTVPELYTKVRAIAHSLEFDHFVYGLRLHLNGGGPAHELVISGYPAAWRQIYEQENYVATDPTVAHCLNSSLPLVWSESLFVDNNAAGLMETAHQFGLRSGLTMPVHSTHLQTGLLSLASDRTAVSFEENLVMVGQAQLFATYLHEAARGLVEKKERAQRTACQLTPREKECLTWAAAGKSSWEIARIVAASERTVNFHIGNLIQKLCVSNRSQAVAKALATGLISL